MDLIGYKYNVCSFLKTNIPNNSKANAALWITILLNVIRMFLSQIRSWGRFNLTEAGNTKLEDCFEVVGLFNYEYKNILFYNIKQYPTHKLPFSPCMWFNYQLTFEWEVRFTPTSRHISHPLTPTPRPPQTIITLKRVTTYPHPAFIITPIPPCTESGRKQKHDKMWSQPLFALPPHPPLPSK